MRILYGLFLILALAGCSREAERRRALTVQEFKSTLAAMQVCTKGSTYNEFRQRRMELEACYVANRSVLQEIFIVKALYSNLLNEMEATDHCWRLYQQNDDARLSPEGRDWDAMLILNPGLKEESGEQAKLRKQKPAYAATYLKQGLSCIYASCEVILNQIDQKPSKQ